MLTSTRQIPYRLLLLPLLIVTLSGFLVPTKQIEPDMQYRVQDRYLLALGSNFPPLTDQQKSSDWGREYRIALHFAQQGDFYRAITAFQRARFLIDQPLSRRQEIDYQILFSYALGNKFQQVITTFANSTLATTNQAFPAHRDLLLLLHESYRQLGNEQQRISTWQQIAQQDPQQAHHLQLSTLLLQGNAAALNSHYQQDRHRNAFLKEPLARYKKHHKSPSSAQLLNAILPGAGYLYLGQTQSAITAFLLNGLCIAAAQQLFHQHQPWPGTLMTTIELGWYVGGIYGAAKESKLYNERLWEQTMLPIMDQQRLLPLLFLRHAF